MSGPIRRQITMLNHIPRSPRKISAANLAEQLERDGYSTTLRTVQRDLNELAREFPLESDNARPQGWCWRKGASIDTFGMDSHAALTFGLVEEYLAPLLPRTTLSHISPWFSAASQIRNNMEPKLQLWQKRIRVLPANTASTPPITDIEIQDTVYDALLNGLQLRITYKAITGKGDAKTYPLHPWGLLVRDSTSYLIGSAKDYNAPRLFKLHRIEHAVLLKEKALVPKDFDIDKFIEKEWGITHDPQPMRIRLKVSALVAKYLLESPMPEQEVIDSHGLGATLEFTAPDNERLRAWLLSLGPEANVLRPAKLRNQIGMKVKLMASHYL